MFDNVKGKVAVVSAAAVAAGIMGVGGGAAVGAAAYDAYNAHKVDGKHAVGAGASIAARRRKLVATNSAGRLPNNIIRKAPNANKLDGRNSTDFAPADHVHEAFGYDYSGSASSTSSTTYGYLPGASTTVYMERSGVLVADFGAESYCDGGGYCSARILVDGLEASPASGTDFAFDSSASDLWEANAMTRIKAVGPGYHTVRVQYEAGSASGTFRLDDWTLTAEGKMP